jgi:hypothetical protein
MVDMQKLMLKEIVPQSVTDLLIEATTARQPRCVTGQSVTCNVEL